MSPLSLFLAIALSVGVSFAEDPPAAASTDAAASPSTSQALMGAIALPGVARQAQVLGIVEADISQALTAAKDRGLSAGEAAEVLGTATDAAKEHGPVDNFGAFVQARLEEGLRGKELAAAIQAEHAANGKGKPDHAGKSGEAGKPDSAGKSGESGGGKPDSAGKSGEAAGGKGKGKGKGGGK